MDSNNFKKSITIFTYSPSFMIECQILSIQKFTEDLTCDEYTNKIFKIEKNKHI